jgi:hypothetical protein
MAITATASWRCLSFDEVIATPVIVSSLTIAFDSLHYGEQCGHLIRL